MIYINLLLIVTIVALIFESGWWDSVDEWINKKYKFYHLPHIIACQFCQSWWLCLFYIIISGHLSLLNIMLCLVYANIGTFITPFITFVKNLIGLLLETLNKLLWK